MVLIQIQMYLEELIGMIIVLLLCESVHLAWIDKYLVFSNTGTLVTFNSSS